MSGVRRHGARIAVTLVPVVLALLHASGFWRLPFLDRLDNFFYDVRLRATMPRTLDPRIVIVDVDDASLQQFGQWPWSRDKLARLTDELIQRQQVAALGFDILFVEPDASSGLPVLRKLAEGPLRGDAGFAAVIERLAPALDRDAVFASALADRPVALGYYFTETAAPRAMGQLPFAGIAAAELAGRFALGHALERVRRKHCDAGNSGAGCWFLECGARHA